MPASSKLHVPMLKNNMDTLIWLYLIFNRVEESAPDNMEKLGLRVALDCCHNMSYLLPVTSPQETRNQPVWIYT